MVHSLTKATFTDLRN